ncbi:MAG: hypothetical protein WC953_03055 [Pseudomonas sp.]
MSPIAILRVVIFYLLAVALATILGGLVQAQIELAALAEPPATFGARLAATWLVLPGLLPTFVAMLAAAFVVVLPIAEGLSRIFRPWRWLLFGLAGAGGIWAAFKVVGTLLPETAITTPSQTWQWLAMLIAIAISSWLFGHLTRPKARRGLRVLG